MGEARRKALLSHFKTVKAIAGATEEQLAQAVPKNTARAVWLHFHPQQEKGDSQCE